MIKVDKFGKSNENDWEKLLSISKNGTFLFSRKYMDYHSHRFKDASFLLYDNSECVGIFSGNSETHDTVVSHSGLTYGGLVLKANVYSKCTLKYFSALLKKLNDDGVKILKIKMAPDFYTTVSQQEVEFGLHVADAVIFKVDLISVVDLNTHDRISMQKRRLRGARKAKKAGLYIEEANQFSEFWNKVLEPNLKKKYGVEPVHSLEEIETLYHSNKDAIRQFNVYLNGNVVAGTTIFDTSTTAHTQYIASTDSGKNFGALDYLFIHLIEDVFSHKNYFSFGRINEEAKFSLNEGLLDWKEGFGARSFVQRYYSIKTENYKLINQLFEG